MRKAVAIISFFLLLTGCKKTVEKLKENAVIDAMTEGQWVVTKFVKNGTTITSDFADYKFQFHSNRTVDAFKNSTVEKTGTWDGDVSTMTITANFQDAALPLTLLNGNWHIDNNSWTFVVASQNSGTETKSLRLEKL
jgi:hypothetical protein